MMQKFPLKNQSSFDLYLAVAYLLLLSYRSIAIHDLSQTSFKAGSFAGYRLPILNTKCNTISINNLAATRQVMMWERDMPTLAGVGIF
jgi:hypothetical protein